jgi:FkbM family methyltransferase
MAARLTVGSLLQRLRRPGYYAEDGTDRYLRETFFRDRGYGVMVEVGAAGPTFLSMSKHFRESNWRVIAVEPQPKFIEQHRKARSYVLPFACSDRDEDDVEFEVVYQPAEYNGGKITYESFSSLGVTDEYRKHNPSITSTFIKVNVRRLDTLLAQEKISSIDLLSIDVEGWELQVLAGFSAEKYRPVIVMENFTRDPRYVSYLEGRGYQLYSERFPNQIFTPVGS